MTHLSTPARLAGCTARSATLPADSAERTAQSSALAAQSARRPARSFDVISKFSRELSEPSVVFAESAADAAQCARHTAKPANAIGDTAALAGNAVCRALDRTPQSVDVVLCSGGHD